MGLIHQKFDHIMKIPATFMGQILQLDAAPSSSNLLPVTKNLNPNLIQLAGLCKAVRQITEIDRKNHRAVIERWPFSTKEDDLKFEKDVMNSLRMPEAELRKFFAMDGILPSTALENLL